MKSFVSSLAALFMAAAVVGCGDSSTAPPAEDTTGDLAQQMEPEGDAAAPAEGDAAAPAEGDAAAPAEGDAAAPAEGDAAEAAPAEGDAAAPAEEAKTE